MIFLFLLAAAVASRGAQPAPKTELSQDITVRARAASLGVQVTPPAASRPVIDEVLRSLALGRGAPAPSTLIHAEGGSSRLSQPFPEPPFLALSPANIVALYDEWTFEVLDSQGATVWKTEGLAVLKERLDWAGEGLAGRLAIIAGRSYHYRFTGRRAGREFTVASEPAKLSSFSHHEYAGETRLEAASHLFFEKGKASFTKEAGRWIDALAGRLRAGEARPDGTYKLELSSRSGKLASARAKALGARLAGALLVAPERITISIASQSRGEAVSAFLPASKGATLRND